MLLASRRQIKTQNMKLKTQTKLRRSGIFVATCLEKFRAPSGRHILKMSLLRSSINYGIKFYNDAAPTALLEEAVNVRCLGFQNAFHAQFLEDAIEGLLGGAAAGLGLAADAGEFGFNELLSREDAGVVPRGDAFDGGGDAFVPGHVARFKQSLNRATSLRVEELKGLGVEAEFKSLGVVSLGVGFLFQFLNSQTPQLLNFSLRSGLDGVSPHLLATGYVRCLGWCQIFRQDAGSTLCGSSLVACHVWLGHV